MCPDDPNFQAKVISLSKQVNQGIHSPDWEPEKGRHKHRSEDRAYTYIINTAYTNSHQILSQRSDFYSITCQGIHFTLQG